MKCNKCGIEFSEGIFCPKCGAKFVEENVKGKDEPIINKKKSKNKVVKYLGLATVVFIVVSIIMVALNGGIDDSETRPETYLDETSKDSDSVEKGDVSESTLVDDNVNSEVTDEASLAWKEAYLNYLNEYGNPEYGYSLDFIDEDDIPELVIASTIAAEGVQICTYNGKELVVTPVGESVMYRLQENSFCVSGGRMDYYYDIVYKIIDGVPTEVGRGEYGTLDYENIRYDEAGDMIYQYAWNGESISEYEYYDHTESFSFENADAWPAGRGYLYDVIEVLSHPLDITIIDPYLNDNGYMSLLNNCVILFDGIVDDKIHFTVSYNGELIGSASATITSAKTAEYKNANSELVIEFDADYSQLKIKGYMDKIDLTSDYMGMWG